MATALGTCEVRRFAWLSQGVSVRRINCDRYVSHLNRHAHRLGALLKAAEPFIVATTYGHLRPLSVARLLLILYKCSECQSSTKAGASSSSSYLGPAATAPAADKTPGFRAHTAAQFCISTFSEYPNWPAPTFMGSPTTPRYTNPPKAR